MLAKFIDLVDLFFLYYGSSYLIYRGYCMVVRRYEIYLRVVTGPH